MFAGGYVPNFKSPPAPDGKSPPDADDARRSTSNALLSLSFIAPQVVSQLENLAGETNLAVQATSSFVSAGTTAGAGLESLSSLVGGDLGKGLAKFGPQIALAVGAVAAIGTFAENTLGVSEFLGDLEKSLENQTESLNKLNESTSKYLTTNEALNSALSSGTTDAKTLSKFYARSAEAIKELPSSIKALVLAGTDSESIKEAFAKAQQEQQKSIGRTSLITEIAKQSKGTIPGTIKNVLEGDGRFAEGLGSSLVKNANVVVESGKFGFKVSEELTNAFASGDVNNLVEALGFTGSEADNLAKVLGEIPFEDLVSQVKQATEAEIRKNRETKLVIALQKEQNNLLKPYKEEIAKINAELKKSSVDFKAISANFGDLDSFKEDAKRLQELITGLKTGEFKTDKEKIEALDEASKLTKSTVGGSLDPDFVKTVAGDALENFGQSLARFFDKNSSAFLGARGSLGDGKLAGGALLEEAIGDEDGDNKKGFVLLTEQLAGLTPANDALKIATENLTVAQKTLFKSFKDGSKTIEQAITALRQANLGPFVSSGSALGFVPNFSAASSERAQAKMGGYTAGAITKVNLPGVGRVTANSAETVKQFPGMSQPAIMPPSFSKAGKNYKKEFSTKHGFSPYAAGGFVPNFANKLSHKEGGILKRIINSLKAGERFSLSGSKDVSFTNDAGVKVGTIARTDKKAWDAIAKTYDNRAVFRSAQQFKDRGGYSGSSIRVSDNFKSTVRVAEKDDIFRFLKRNGISFNDLANENFKAGNKSIAPNRPKINVGPNDLKNRTMSWLSDSDTDFGASQNNSRAGGMPGGGSNGVNLDNKNAGIKKKPNLLARSRGWLNKIPDNFSESRAGKFIDKLSESRAGQLFKKLGESKGGQLAGKLGGPVATALATWSSAMQAFEFIDSDDKLAEVPELAKTGITLAAAGLAPFAAAGAGAAAATILPTVTAIGGFMAGDFISEKTGLKGVLEKKYAQLFYGEESDHEKEMSEMAMANRLELSERQSDQAKVLRKRSEESTLKGLPEWFKPYLSFESNPLAPVMDIETAPPLPGEPFGEQRLKKRKLLLDPKAFTDKSSLANSRLLDRYKKELSEKSGLPQSFSNQFLFSQDGLLDKNNLSIFAAGRYGSNGDFHKDIGLISKDSDREQYIEDENYYKLYQAYNETLEGLDPSSSSREIRSNKIGQKVSKAKKTRSGVLKHLLNYSSRNTGRASSLLEQLEREFKPEFLELYKKGLISPERRDAILDRAQILKGEATQKRGAEFKFKRASSGLPSGALDSAQNVDAEGLAAHGFVPNLAGGESLARKTENRLAGSAIRSFDPKIGTYYRSAGQPSNLNALIRRDHPEGLSQAIKGSYSSQHGSTPNFAPDTSKATEALTAQIKELVSLLKENNQLDQATQQSVQNTLDFTNNIGDINIAVDANQILANFQSAAAEMERKLMTVLKNNPIIGQSVRRQYA